MKTFAISSLITLLFTTNLVAQKTDDPAWAKWKFLVGEWAGEFNGQPGVQSTIFSFEPDLNKQIITGEVRIAPMDTGIGSGRIRKDLLIIYNNMDAKLAKAIYFDNTGRVIDYYISFNDDSSVVFTSPAINDQPRYRITYYNKAKDRIRIKSESSPQGQPNAFTLVNEGNWIRLK